MFSTPAAPARRRRAAVLAAAALVAACAVPAPAHADSVTICTRWTSSTTPPTTIKVLIYGEHDSRGWGSNPLRVDTVPMRDYVRNVLPNEWISSWPAASLQAGAVAVKEYAWYFTMHVGHGGAIGTRCFDVTDDIRSQRYIPGSATPATDAAVDATWGMSLTQNGALFAPSYRANLTGANTEGCGAGRATRPQLLSQWGSRACAAAGRPVSDILTIYYAGAAVALAGATSTTVADLARTPSGTGYWTLGADGSVQPHGTAASLGQPKGAAEFSGQRAVAIASTPTGKGYWVLTAAGAVFGYGDAVVRGIAPAGRPYAAGQSAVDLEVSASGAGYWIVMSSGAVHAFGDARYLGAP